MTVETDHVKMWQRMVRLVATDSTMANPDAALAKLAEEQLTSPAIPTLLRFTDARAANGSIASRDGPFVYIAATVGDQVGTTSVDWLHQRFFARVLRIWHDDQEFAESLQRAAFRPDYWAQAADLDRWLDDRHRSLDLDERPVLVRDRDPAGTLNKEWWRSLIAGSPRLSQVPVEHVRADAGQLAEHPTHLPDYGDDPDSYHKAAQQLLHAARAEDANFDLHVRARLDVALDLVKRRRFAKVRMLELGWPELMERVRMPGGIRRLRQLEAKILGDPDAEPPSEVWLSYIDDERLVEFLSLQPLFRAIFDDVLTRTVGISDEHPAGPAPSPGEEREWAPYVDAELSFKVMSQDAGRWRGTATLHTPAAERQWRVDIALTELANAVSNLARIYLAALSFPERPGQASPFPRQPEQGTHGMRVAVPDAREAVESIGEELWAQTFGADPDALSDFMGMLAEPNRIRLTVSADTIALTDLPWECLRIPELRVMAGLTLKLSIVRRVSESVSLTRRSLGMPVRVLAVLAEPADVAPLPGARQELRLLTEMFAEAEDRGVASLVTIANATVSDLRENLRRFRPHILHFIGHGITDEAAGAALVLTGEDGNVFKISADQLAVQLQDSGVTMAVLNGCDTGVSPTSNEATFGVSQAIIRQGVPAVVATVRTVADNAALRFSQEFYQALIDGYPLEACVTEARKGLFMQGWDWSAWGTFASDAAALDLIRLRKQGGLLK